MIRVFSYGGGVQSTAALVLAAQGQIDYRTFLFCNVGADSENPETLEYVEQVAMPFAARSGIELIELTRPGETLYGRVMGSENRGYVIPAYTPTKKGRLDGAPGKRVCTMDFKVRVVDGWLEAHGAQEQGALVGLGISRDEVGRVKPNMDKATMTWKQNAWPLLFDVEPMDRQSCENAILAAGLPIPPKSACWFCPHHSRRRWQEMRENDRTTYQRAAALERRIQANQIARQLPMVYLTRYLKPLDKLTTDDFTQIDMFEEDACESGYCMV